MMWTSVQTIAQNPEFTYDPWEVQLVAPGQVDRASQRLTREAMNWSAGQAAASGWQVLCHVDRALPARMWGPGVVFEDASPEVCALQAWDWALSTFHWDASQMGPLHVAKGQKHLRVFGTQTFEGLPVLGSKFQAKFKDHKLVMVGSDYWPELQAVEDLVAHAEVESMLEATMAVNPVAGQTGTNYITEFDVHDLGMAWLPIKRQQEGRVEWLAHPVWTLEITGRRGVLPVKYLTWVDMTNGEVVFRVNQVMHDSSHDSPRRMGGLSERPVMAVNGQVKATVQENYPPQIEDAVSLAMPHLELPLGPVTYFTNTEGVFSTPIEEDVLDVNLGLKGLFATVFSNGITPTETVDFVNGFNSISAPGNVREVSAYRNTNLIHDHMREWLPDFSDLDWSMPVNIDVEGECNAFYDGSSINFFIEAGDCNATSLIADVVYHEYGHAINDWYYSSLGSAFINGAMNEGYADFWAISLAEDIAEIGKGFYIDNDDGIRRYDVDPKVYPEDIVGEVHADGEIICGAWYDTHLLMGEDWDATMSLFIDAFPGLQANVPGGFEGVAYTDVLLDALQADDDDADLLNGTPNAEAIIEGFAIHGINLFSYIDLAHAPVEFASAGEDILIEAEADITFPYVTYFDAVRLHYRLAHGDDWTVVSMTQDGDVFSHVLQEVPGGTVVEYYMDIVDVFGGESSVSPIAANKPINGNLPHHILVGLYPVLINDLDDYSEFGYWDMDLPTDNATTGQWEEATPVGSLTNPQDFTTVVAPFEDHTEGANGFAYITGLNPELGSGIGENDVDGGHTTLVSPVIDLSPYENPVLAYWRWYTNAPATGANPGTDWWQVEVSNDAGNTWQYLENTSQQDISWRRNAFNIADVLEPTETFQIRFIASDSTTLGEYLDGGSLVEAAVDDIVLYDVTAPETSILEERIAVELSPNPAHSRTTSSGWIPGSSVRIFDANGRIISTHRANGWGSVDIDVSHLSEGTYVVSGWDLASNSISLKLQVVRSN